MKLDEASILLDQARLALKKGGYDEAHSLVDRVLKELPDYGEAHNLKALIFFKEKKYREAKRLFLDLYKKFPGEHALVLNLGICSLKLEEWQEALEYLHRALELQPNNPKIHNYLGLAYSGIGQFQRAKEEFLKGGSQKMANQMLSLLRSDSGSPPSAPTVTSEVPLSLDEGEKALTTPPTPTVEEPGAFETAIDQAFTPAPYAPETTEGETSPPQDLLAQALRALRKRYEQVLETGLLGKGLKDLVSLLELRKEWERPVGLLEPNLVGIELIPQRFTVLRAYQLVGFLGDMNIVPLNKRYKGKELKAPFGTPENPLFQVMGSGEIFLRPPDNQRFFLFKLENELVYLMEDHFFGMIGEFRWENGRLPSPQPPEEQIVQVRGEGHILLTHSQADYLQIIMLSGGKFTLNISHLLGWFGTVVPLVTVWGKEKQQLVVQFQGNGGVILKLPHL